VVQGTQYVTCEELENQSILDLENWETQAFADFKKDNQVKEKYSSKGEFCVSIVQGHVPFAIDGWIEKS